MHNPYWIQTVLFEIFLEMTDFMNFAIVCLVHPDKVQWLWMMWPPNVFPHMDVVTFFVIFFFTWQTFAV